MKILKFSIFNVFFIILTISWLDYLVNPLLGFGEKPIDKSGSGKVSKTQVCLVFIDFLPESVKILGVGYSYPTEWLLPVILSYLAPPNSLSVAFCAILKNSRGAPPSANYLNIYLHIRRRTTADPKIRENIKSPSNFHLM